MSAADFSPITTAISSAVSGADVATVIGVALGASIGLFLVAWGAKKIIRSVRGALNGRLK